MAVAVTPEWCGELAPHAPRRPAPGEDGLDAGGVTKELVALALRALLDPARGLFEPSANAASLHPRDDRASARAAARAALGNGDRWRPVAGGGRGARSAATAAEAAAARFTLVGRLLAKARVFGRRAWRM